MNETPKHAAKIMVIRHAEKPLNALPPYGITLEGEREKESLTVRGWQRAGALASLFGSTNGPQDPSLSAPQFLYASKPKKRNGSKRPIETISPLAEKLAIRVNSNFTKLEAERMLEEAFLCDGVVLICWQSQYIPKIANYILGNKTTAPQEWPEDRFDVIWVFDRRDTPAPGYSFKQVPQNLLIGDWSTPIKK